MLFWDFLEIHSMIEITNLNLQSIKEFFDMSVNLDLLFQSWNESQENPKKALKLYKKKRFK